ncbi:MAG: acyl-CoA dehydrogenase family protein [Nitrososphaerales archaeon]
MPGSDEFSNLSVMNFELSDEQKDLLEQIGKACNSIRDYETECYLSERINEKVIPTFAPTGMLGLPISKKYNGKGVDALTYALALEGIGREGSSLRTFFSCHVSIGQLVLQNWGNEEQKRKYLPNTTTGKSIMAFALTEPPAGSDPASMTTKFEEKGGNYVLNGKKHWIGNATIADVITTYAKSDDGKVSAFIVQTDSKGFSANRIQHKMGLHSLDNGEITFDDCVVPKENLIGLKGRGLSVAYSALMDGRLSVAAGSVGVMEDCLSEAVKYSKTRVQFGEPLAKKQLIQKHIASIASNIESARWLVYRACAAKQKLAEYVEQMKKDNNWLENLLTKKNSEYTELRNEADKLVALAKYYATNAAFDSTNRTVQIFGSAGYSKKSRAARHLLDSRASMILEGANEVLELKIAQHILGKEYRAY